MFIENPRITQPVKQCNHSAVVQQFGEIGGNCTLGLGSGCIEPVGGTGGIIGYRICAVRLTFLLAVRQSEQIDRRISAEYDYYAAEDNGKQLVAGVQIDKIVQQPAKERDHNHHGYH